jgi:glycosyltransferase involved in cell wall biosynthesis
MTQLMTDLICFSHLRWSFVFQRPQHLMSRFARHSRIFFFEEPVYEGSVVKLNHSACPSSGVRIMTPVLPPGTSPEEAVEHQRRLLHEMQKEHGIEDFAAWYYTPMALNFTNELKPSLTIYDCMDELSAFAGAPPAMRLNEQVLFSRADLVFTGGRSLYESKQASHPSVHLFPSSVDVAHFGKARSIKTDPEDQRSIPHPRIGFVGVIDERMDIQLLAHIAQARPDWHLVMVGPIVKIDPATLPQFPNIHYLGMKTYEQLPSYLAGWDVAMLPFAQNESTRFISPTKTPEYLAAGCPVVSTPIRDVVRPYGDLGLVKIGKSGEEFVAAIDSILQHGMKKTWQAEVNSFLDNLSWDQTWMNMRLLMEEKLSLSLMTSAQAVGLAEPLR